MKKHYIFSFAILLMLVVSACSKSWFDVNTDPNNPSSASPELVLPSATASAGTVVGGYYNLLGGFWSQYWTQSAGSNQYKNIDTYQLLNSDFDRQWQELYTGTFKNFKYIKDQAVASKSWSFYFMATVVESYAYQVLVDLYDQIPFNEAIGGAQNTQPHFDNAQTVYDSITSRLEKLASLDLSTPLSSDQKSKDFVFGGDMSQWKAFANTLLLKIYMRQMYVRPSVAQTGIQGLYARNAAFLTTDAKLDIFVDQPNKDNPLYESNIRGLNTSVNLRASGTLFNYLANNSDPRKDKIYGFGPDGATTPIAAPQGSFSTTYYGTADVLKKTSVVIQKPTDPVYFISTAESYFLQAEAVAKGWVPGDDQALYNAGVAASFAKYGLDGSSLIAGVYAYPTGGDFEAKQKAIIMAKWVSMASTEGIEAFFETNRTHYPSVSSYVFDGNATTFANWEGGELQYSLTGVTGGKFPKRLLFPDYEVTRNPNTPTEVPITQKVWWDTK